MDGMSQELSPAVLEANGHSAVFDGGTVMVELVSSNDGNLFQGGNKHKSRVVVSQVKVGVYEDDGTAPAIYRMEDDRIALMDPWQGRIGRCTAWLISKNVFVHAGHCGTPITSTHLHFTYSIGSDPIQDQYAADIPSYHFLNNGVGQDWGTRCP